MAEQGSDSGDLTATLKGGSDMVYDLYCEVCADFDKHLEAKGFCTTCSDYLCDDCVKAHGTQRSLRNHVVQTRSQMPRQKPPPSLSKSTTGSISDQCDQHSGQLTEYYCKDDGSLGCTVCMTVKHRQCRSVDHVADISEQLLDSEEYQQFTASLTSLKVWSQNIIKRANDNTSQAEKLCTDVTTALKELRRKVIGAFDQMDKDIKKKTDTMKSADVEKLKDIGDKGKEVLSEVEKIFAELQTLRNKNQLGQLFVRMIKLENRVQALHTVLDEADADNNVNTFMFEPGTAAQELLDKPDAIGKLSVQASIAKPQTSVTKPQTSVTKPQASGTTPEPAPQKTTTVPRKMPAHQKPLPAPPVAAKTAPPTALKAVKVGDLNVKTEDDDCGCGIMGSVLLSSNKLILADYNNSKLKLLNLQTSTITSELKTSPNPWDVASISENQSVVVSVSGKIAFVNVTSVLKLDREIRVARGCTGIVHTNGKLIVAFCEPVKIEIMDMNGSVEKKIECSNMFDFPSHVTISPVQGAIYVSDGTGYCVKKLSMAGTVTAEYRDKVLLSYPRSLIVDQQGRVLVCGAASNNIHILTPELKKIKLLVDGIYSPQSLSLCHSSGKLYVGRRGDTVSVYQLS